MSNDDNARKQAIAQFRSIVDMVKRLRSDDAAVSDQAREEIEQDALSVQVRSGWYTPGDAEGAKPAEYELLLCTGGPAVRIVGALSEYGEPESAHLEFQDWFTPWAEWRTRGDQSKFEAWLIDYARCFYFGEG